MRGSFASAVLAASVCSICALTPGRAFAEDASNQAAAQALFEQARQLMADGKFGEACPKLAESERLDPGAGTLLNLGHCYEKNGQTASAWVTFKDAAAAAEIKHRADWSARARERAQALEATLSRLTIDVPPEARTSGLQVRRDGVEVGAAVWGTPIPTDPGSHAIEASAPTKKPWRTTLTVGASADQAHVSIPALQDEIEPSAASRPGTAPVVAPPPVAPVTTATSTPPPDLPPPSSGSGQKVAGLVVGGVGIVGLGLGAVFGLVATGKESDSQKLCPTTATTCGSSSGIQENDDAKTQATLSTVAFVAGGALVVAGAVLYLTAPKARPATAIRLTPAVGMGEVGLRVGGAW
jgi:hypothetical protein